MPRSYPSYLIILGSSAVFPSLCSAAVIGIMSQYTTSLAACNSWQIAGLMLISVFTMSLAITPTTLVAIVSGYFWGWSYCWMIPISYLLASVLGLCVGQWLTRRLDILFTSQKLLTIQNKVNQQQLLFIALTRLSPVLPFAMTNLALANLPIRWRSYLMGSLLGMLPRTLLFFYAGTQTATIWNFAQHPSLKGSLQIVPIVLVLTSTLGLLYFIKKKL